MSEGAMVVEEWRVAAGQEGVSVSDRGRVRYDADRGRGVSAGDPVPVQRGASGHPFVTLGGRSLGVGKLVAEAFLGPRPRPTDVAVHADRDPLNCAAANLSWGRPLGGPGAPKLARRQVLSLRARASRGARFAHLAEAYGLSKGTVSRAVRGLTSADVGGPRTAGAIGRPRRGERGARA